MASKAKKHLNLRTKFIWVSATVCAGLVGLAALGWVSLAKLSTVSLAAQSEGRLLIEGVNLARSAQVNFKKEVQEWKDILLRGNDPESFAKYRKAFDAEEAATQSNLHDLSVVLEKLGLPVDKVAGAIQEHQALGVKYRAALGQFDQSKESSGKVVDKLVKGIDRPATSAIDVIVGDIQAASEDRAHVNIAQMTLIVRRTRLAILIGGTGAGVIILIAFMRSLPAPFRILAAELRAAADHVTAAAEQVSEASQTLARGASEQAASLEETGASLEEMSSMAKRNAESSAQVNTLMTDEAGKNLSISTSAWRPWKRRSPRRARPARRPRRS